MATAEETTRGATAEAARVAWDATRLYLDQSTEIGHTYFNAWSGTIQAGMRAAFDLQNAMIQASRVLVTAGSDAGGNWYDQVNESVRRSQDATADLVTSALNMVESAMPKPPKR